MAIILASASPRRKELLSLITADFIIKVSDADEGSVKTPAPEETAKALAAIKGDAVSSLYPDDTVISADTIVVLGDRILGKPHGREEAYEMLSALSGKTHTVYTGVQVISEGTKTVFAESTSVTFYPLTDDEINGYINTLEPFDKAGAYGIQGKGALLIKEIYGDYYNVMGLPVAKLARIMKEKHII